MQDLQGKEEQVRKPRETTKVAIFLPLFFDDISAELDSELLPDYNSLPD
jgi:hypothetical protein